ncbi:hypothetical protein SAMN04489727_8706 [Amycolatopsis tolypomycina]|uniref:Uncharacterized protein n=1 Tax=Amycolatopsis tolypomycina TaxID=208445 RepID=A0A1H5CCQ4_9PSEU|nr:hypothetical protein [Amycolatopsis tolypomycina]SED64268.1 hypothetical protein SAMN04489727_8706 [Amycolatopsis tolypomycina]
MYHGTWRLLALRVGARGYGLRERSEQAVAVAVLGAYLSVFVAGIDFPGRGAFVAVSCTVALLVRWWRMQRRERLAERLVPPGPPLPLRVAARQVGWVYLSAVAVCFAGGAVLCATTFLSVGQSTGKHWYSPPLEVTLQTMALAVGAGATALVLGKALRSPVIAEDEASRLVDGVLRAEDVHRYTSCAVYAFFAVPVLMMDWQPSALLEWTAWTYVAVVAALELTGRLLVHRRHRRLPPGFYGR